MIAVETTMSSEAQLKLRLKAVANLPANQVCCDCGDKKPTWASLIVPPPHAPKQSRAVGAFCCFHCSGAHRRLGVHICFVRSVTLDDWKEKEVIAMELGGNERINQAFEAKYEAGNADGTLKPHVRSSLDERDAFIKAKYSKRAFFDQRAYEDMMAQVLCEIDDGTLARRTQQLLQMGDGDSSHQQQPRRRAQRRSSLPTFSPAANDNSYDDLFAGETMTDMFSDSKRNLFEGVDVMDFADPNESTCTFGYDDSNDGNDSDAAVDATSRKTAMADVQTFGSVNDSSRMIEVTQFVVQDNASRSRRNSPGDMMDRSSGHSHSKGTSMKHQVMELNKAAAPRTSRQTKGRSHPGIARSQSFSARAAQKQPRQSSKTVSKRAASSRNLVASTGHERKRVPMRRSSLGGNSHSSITTSDHGSNRNLSTSAHRSGSSSSLMQHDETAERDQSSSNNNNDRSQEMDNGNNKSSRSSNRRRTDDKSRRSSRRTVPLRDTSSHRSRSRSVRAKGRTAKSSNANDGVENETAATRVPSKSASMLLLQTHSKHSKRRLGSARPPSRTSSFESDGTDGDDCTSTASSRKYSGTGSVCSNSNDYFIGGDDDDDDRSRYSRASTGPRSRSRSRRGGRRHHHAAARMVVEANATEPRQPTELQNTMKRDPRHSTRRLKERSKSRDGMSRSTRRRRSNGEDGAEASMTGGSVRRTPRSRSLGDSQDDLLQESHVSLETTSSTSGVVDGDPSRMDRARLRRSQRHQHNTPSVTNNSGDESSEPLNTASSVSRRRPEHMQRQNGLSRETSNQHCSHDDLELSSAIKERRAPPQRSRSSASPSTMFGNATAGRVKKRSALSSSTMEWLAKEDELLTAKLKNNGTAQDAASKQDQSTSAETTSSNSSIES